MYIRKIGKGPCHRIGWSNRVSMPLEFRVSKYHKDYTIEQIVLAIIGKFNIKNGSIIIDHIAFTFEERGNKREIKSYKDLYD